MDFTQDREAARLAGQLRQAAAEGRYLVSDLVTTENGQTLQYVDLVMEGGGTLGIALVGYIYALEQAGIRFLSVGGSSVGAIVALLLACLGGHADEKGPALARVLGGMDMASFIDGKGACGRLSHMLGTPGASQSKLRLALAGLFASKTLFARLGLNPGASFLHWLTGCLEGCGVRPLADARGRIEPLPPGLAHRHKGQDFTRPSPSLKIVTADLTTHSKIIFPEMAPLYWAEPERVNPALFARASMSIPGFFQPMEVTGVAKIIGSSQNWKNLCSFDGQVPDRVLFADGGLLSNFPISLFHQNRVPNAPTLGARLGDATRQLGEIKTVGGYAGGLLATLRHCNDYDFIYKNPDYRSLIAHIPTAGHNWLNFGMADDEKLILFKKGMAAAHSFLEHFDWEGYKALRKAQAEYARAARRP